MRRLMLAMLLLGVALLAVVVARTDLDEVARHIAALGPLGALAVLLAFSAAHLGLAASWLLTLTAVPVSARWLYRCWKVLMVGGALEALTPLAGLGGEPAKALLLKRHYGVAYPAAATSLVLTRTTDISAQLVFIGLGLAWAVHRELLPPALRLGALLGLGLFALAVLLFLLLQTRRGLSRAQGWLERGPLGARLGERGRAALAAVCEVEDQLVAFYRERRGRFAGSTACALADWVLTAAAVWLALRGFGLAVGPGEALAIEAFVTLVRSTLFFVPGDLGTQEAAQVAACAAVLGAPEAGLAVAALRRGRDLLWILWGLAIGGRFALRA